MIETITASLLPKAIDIVTSLISDKIYDWIKEDADLQSRMFQCFDKALDKWDDVPLSTREEMKGDASKHFSRFKSYIDNPAKGEHPCEKNLLRLWAEEMLHDSVCAAALEMHKLDTIKSKQEDQTKILLEILQDIRNSAGNKQQLHNLVSDVIANIVEPLISELKTKHALQIIEELENHCHDCLQEDRELQAKVCFCKAECKEADAEECYRLYEQAWNLCACNEKYISVLSQCLCMQEKYGEAERLIRQLPCNNAFRRAYEVATAENPEQEFDKCSEKLQKSYTFRQHICSLLSRKGKDATCFQLDQTTIPSELRHENLLDWTFVIFSRMRPINGIILFIHQQWYAEKAKPALEVIGAFLDKLKNTDRLLDFKEIKALHYYMSYMSDGNSRWLNEYQQLKMPTPQQEAMVFFMMEVAMLSMEQRYDEAFSRIAALGVNLIDEFVLQMAISIFMLSGCTYIMHWAFSLASSRKIAFGGFTAKQIAFAINESNCTEVASSLNSLEFSNPTDKEVLLQRCKLIDKKPVETKILDTNPESYSKDLVPFVAILYSETGKIDYAVNLLKPIIDESNLDFSLRVFIELMLKQDVNRPYVYRLLKKLRKSGFNKENALLEQELNMAMAIGNNEDALEITTLLYNRYPNIESVLTNHIVALGLNHKKELRNHYDEVMHFKFTATSAVERIFNAYYTEGMKDEALEFIYQKTIELNNVDADFLYFSLSTTTDLKKVIDQEYDVADEGLYVLCDIDGERRCIKVDINTELGETLLGVSKGDIVNLCSFGTMKQVEVITVQNKYGALHCDIIRKTADGSNPHIHIIHPDMTHPLESLEEALKEIDPDSENYQQRREMAWSSYEQKKLGLIHLANDSEPIDSYYKYLFTPSKVVVCPPIALQVLRNGFDINKYRYVLGLSSLLMLFEFSQKYNITFATRFVLPKALRKYLERASKRTGSQLAYELYEGIGNGCAKRFKRDYIDLDYQIRMRHLLKWVDENCEMESNDAALVVMGKVTTVKQQLFFNWVGLSFSPNNILVSDNVNMFIGTNIPAITTEALITLIYPQYLSNFHNFLFDCHYVGFAIQKDEIVREYKKMEKGEANHWNIIVDSIQYNPTLITATLNATRDVFAYPMVNDTLARVSFTNLLSLCIKSLPIAMTTETIRLVKSLAAIPATGAKEASECLNDALAIVKPIIV